MADTKISAATAVATPAGTDQYATNQGGLSKRTTLSQINTFVRPFKIVAGSDVTSTDNTNWADITGLTFAVVNAAEYIFEAVLFTTSAATTTAIQISCNGPTTTRLRYAVHNAIAASGNATDVYAVQTAYDTVVNPATGPGATALPVYVNGYIKPSADGTLALRLRSEISASTVTVLQDSYMIITRI